MFKPINIIKNQFKWAKKHPVQAIALGALVGGGASFLPALLGSGGAAGAGTVGAGTVGADLGAGMVLPAIEGSNILAGSTGAGLLGGGTLGSNVAGGLAGMFGPSEFTAALAGDAFMPAALGAGGTGAPGMGSLLGAKLASGSPMYGQALRGAGKGLMNQQQNQPQPMPAMGGMPNRNLEPTATNTVPQYSPQMQVGGRVGIDPKNPQIGPGMDLNDPRILALLMQAQGRGYA